jgi:hypothetical protein
VRHRPTPAEPWVIVDFADPYGMQAALKVRTPGARASLCFGCTVPSPRRQPGGKGADPGGGAGGVADPGGGGAAGLTGRARRRAREGAALPTGLLCLHGRSA